MPVIPNVWIVVVFVHLLAVSMVRAVSCLNKPFWEARVGVGALAFKPGNSYYYSYSRIFEHS